MTEIVFLNRQRKVKVTDIMETTVSSCVSKALEREKFPCDARVSVTFVSNDQIKKINKEFRSINSATDVLSFPLLETDKNGKVRVSPSDVGPDGYAELGDIVISLERAAAQSEEYGHSFERELGFLSVHSTLHLVGYDHEDDGEREVMREKEEAALSELGLTR